MCASLYLDAKKTPPYLLSSDGSGYPKQGFSNFYREHI